MRAKLVAAATQAYSRAYAPYSGFCVGAALAHADGRVTAAANVENCSYGLSLCAERSAVVAAVADGAAVGDFVALAVVTDAVTPAAPCGACRQVLIEFCSPTLSIVLHSRRGAAEVQTTLGALLPNAFVPAALQR
jgi:homotetrameric cytidine deaminase